MLNFETRIPPPVILLITLIAMLIISRFDADRILRVDHLAMSTWAAVLLTFLGIGFAVMGLRQFRNAQTTINPLKPHASSTLVVSGVYQLSRNPMYLGMALVGLGSVMYYGSAWCLLALFAFITFITRYQIIPEERAMHTLFGDEFDTYKGQTRRWI